MPVSGTVDLENVGPYRLERLLGRGGMGEVYVGFDERLDRPVALKRFWLGRQEPAKVRKRFRREARAAARLHHPAIVQVFDWVETEDSDWIVMELVPGASLRALLRAGPLASQRAARLAWDILSGLAAAHAAGLVHRDLKAENVMVTAGSSTGRKEQAKILDFGLAKRFNLQAPETQVSAEGALIGTLTAMSPEQVQGGEIGPRSDLFSLGSLLYEMVTGDIAFRGNTQIETIQRICTWQPPSASDANPAVSEAFSGLIGRLLEKDPRYRPQSAEQTLLELEAVLAEFPEPGPEPWTASEDLEAEGDITLLEEPPDRTLGRGVARSEVAESEVAESEVAGPDVARSDAIEPGVGDSDENKRAFTSTRRRWLTLLAVVVAVALLAAWWWLVRPVEPLYVVVPETVISSTIPPEDRKQDLELTASAVHTALQQGLLGFQALTTLTPGTDFPQEPAALARAAGADEVLVSRLDCGAYLCQLVLQRFAGLDGHLLWTQGLSIDAGQLLEVSRAVIEHLPTAYPDRRLRPGISRLEVRPEDYAAYIQLKRKFRQRKGGFSVDELVTELDRLQRSSPRYPPLPLLEMRILLTAFQETRDSALLQRAEESLERARRIAPEEDPRVLNNQAHLARIAGRIDAAEQALESLQRLQPGNTHAMYQRARLLERAGRTEQALALMDELLKRLPSFGYHIDYSGMLSRSGDVEGARQALEAALERVPNHYAALSRLAQLELMNGSAQRAAELYEGLVERSPETAELTNLGTAYMLIRRYAEAAHRFRQALELAPGSPFTLLNLADAELLAGRLPEAASYYEQVLEHSARDPNPEKLLTVRAQALAHLERSPEAVAAIQEALRLAPENPMTAYEASLVFVLVGDGASARWNAQRALDKGVHSRWFSFPWFDEVRAGLEPQDSQPES